MHWDDPEGWYGERGGRGVQDRVLWISRSNESVLEDINPKDSLEGLMLKLKLQYFGHLM